ncbi:MAG: PDZ domain-containing protein [Lachnospiraceae bacterium]|jgi:serine protease Do|nr:PDZ domain-containing protein [Lachnospiraceae bacterium]
MRMDDNRKENSEAQGRKESPEAASDFEFLQEKIKERPINKRKLLKRTLITASMAVLFGLLACLSFLLLEPVLNNWLYPEEEPEVVTFPQEQNEMLPEDMLTEGTTAGETQEEGDETAAENSSVPSGSGGGQPNAKDPDPAEKESDEKALDEKVLDEKASDESVLNEKDLNETVSGEKDPDEKNPDETISDESVLNEKDPNETISNGADPGEGDAEELAGAGETAPVDMLKSYQTQYEELYKIYRQVESSMVTVTAVRSDVDWFNNTYQSEGTTAGVIIANNNRELLILSRKSSLDGAETIRISFCDGTDAEAVIKQFDQNTDLAVLAADLKYIGGNTLDTVAVATLGSSISSGITGSPIIAVGNLFGYKDAVCYGMVTSKGNVVTMADSEYKLMTTDIYAGSNPSGILVNMRGEVIGVIDNSHNHDDTRNLLAAVGITELKGLISKLSNGEHVPYLGIYAQDISAQARAEMGLPQGAYIVDIDMDSPAMRKGIQKGDIVVRVGTQEIKNAADYMNVLRNAQTDGSINIVVQRASVNAYEEMHFVLQPEQQEQS